LLVIFAGLALSLALATPAPLPHRRRVRAVQKTAAQAKLLRAEQTALLALRQEMLHDFLVRVGTEAPAFQDLRVQAVDGGVTVGPTAVDIDFLGSPIVRARVRNTTRQIQTLMLTAVLRAGQTTARATVIVDRLGSRESRAVELFVPEAFVPKSVSWQSTPL